MGGWIELDMSDYAGQAVDLYCECAGITRGSLGSAPTPFLPDTSWKPEEDDTPGILAKSAARLLMKDLWLARLARPDLSKAIADLATHMQKWTKTCDKRVKRLSQYLNASCSHKLQAWCFD